MSDPRIHVEGLADTLAALRRAGAGADQLSAATKAAADELISTARHLVPVASGRLASSMRAEGRPRVGVAVADTRYAAVIHFGWSTRGLGRRVGAVTGRQGTALAVARQRQTGLALATIRKAGRQQRRGIRGGPIRPQPWLYEAWDQRNDAIIDRFDDQLDRILAAGFGAD